MLAPYHLDMLLKGSLIRQELVAARGYRTITSPAELEGLGFSPAQRRAPGLLIPLWTTDGCLGPAVYRPDNPRVSEDRRKHNPDGTHPNRVIKYEMPKGAGMRLDCPPTCQPRLQDPAVPLWITEGQKKADSLASLGLCAIALLGVWNFKGRNRFGAATFLADWDYVALSGRQVRIVFDSDVSSRTQVRQALERLREHLQRKGARVDVVYLPAQPGGGKTGVDDWLALGHSLEELEGLVEAPRPEFKAAPPQDELIGEPSAIRRPLCLVDGVSYAAAWLHVKRTYFETVDKRGEVVRCDPPKVKKVRDLFLVRQDGEIFGEGMGRNMEELGLELQLPEPPRANRLWSTKGVKRYHSGKRPDPADVFQRLEDVVDRFIDFERSLADQQGMLELVGCYVLSTWFLDAFGVVGYLWMNGERGCGKTNLLMIITELAHLGQVLTAGSSFASLRDLGDSGATLALDDAENISDSRRFDADKRTLLLAGNRRGVTVTMKEMDLNRRWVTREVNAFCPFLFSSIRLPEPVLASRSIIIPLVRTVDRSRANADPQDHDSWPHKHGELLDDLWALGLSRLPELKEADAYAGEHATLTGRSLQPWRSILAVAAWLDQNGVPGIWERMNKLSVDYQQERPELEFSDLTALTVRAIVSAAEMQLFRHKGDEKGMKAFELTTLEITEAARQIAEAEDSTVEKDHITAQRLGHILRKLRLRKFRNETNKQRGWSITTRELGRLAQSYGIALPEALLKNQNDVDVQAGTSLDIGIIGDIGGIGPEVQDDPDEDRKEWRWKLNGTI